MTIKSMTPTLTDGNLRLRAPSKKDALARLALGRTPSIEHMFGQDPDQITPMTLDDATAWVKSQVEAENTWFIDVDETFIGTIFLHSIKNHDGRAVLGVSIFDESRLGKGYGTRAMRLMFDHVFNTMGLHRIALRTIEYNQRAISAYKKLGFVEEGRERESAFVAGKWYDDVMMGLLSHEFNARWATT